MATIHYSPSAIDDLDRLPQEDRARVLRKVGVMLVESPYPRGKNPKRLHGSNLYRLRVGSYRVIYRIESPKRVAIRGVAHRKDAYRDL